MSDFETVIYEKEGEVAWVTFNRPEKLNALNLKMWTESKEALELADLDEEVRAVILTGSGRAFCAGDDIGLLKSMGSVEEALEVFASKISPMVDKLTSMSKPVIAAVNGIAYGGGCEIVMLCDMAVASSEASFALPEAWLGALPPLAVVLAPFIVARKKAVEMVLTGAPISAEEAEKMGLVNRVVPPDKLKDAAVELARKTMMCAPTSMRLMKRLLNLQIKSFQKDVEIALRDIIMTTQTGELKEGTSAFFEKRKARWMP